MGLFNKTDTDTDTAERAALRDRVHPPNPCWACGTAASHATVATRTALNGDPIAFSACNNCANSTNLDRDVAARLLDVDPTDPALAGLRLTKYADTLPTPRTTADAWSHVDLGAVAGDLMRARDEFARRAGGPCTACGLSILPDVDELWSNSAQGLRCPSCVYRLGGRYDTQPLLSEQRALAVAQLVGIGDGEQRKLSMTLGPLIKLWGDLPDDERVPGGEHPWAWIDVPALAREVARLREIGALSKTFVGNKWTPEAWTRSW